MDDFNYPSSIADLTAWSLRHHSTLKEARLRFVQFVILNSISSSEWIRPQLAFKGGNALLFAYGNPRATLDLDFTAERTFPDDHQEITRHFDIALDKMIARHQIKARCQSIHRKPPGMNKTTPTYLIKVCHQIPGDKYYQNFGERLKSNKTFSDVVDIEVCINDIICETEMLRFHRSTSAVRICTIEDIIAEKLRALLQQVPRNRSPPQDVYDISSAIRRHGAKIDSDKVSSFLLRKSEARNINASKNHFNESVRERAIIGYEKEILPFTSDPISFDDAWTDVLMFVSRLIIPE